MLFMKLSICQLQCHEEACYSVCIGVCANRVRGACALCCLIQVWVFPYSIRAHGTCQSIQVMNNG